MNARMITDTQLLNALTFLSEVDEALAIAAEGNPAGPPADAIREARALACHLRNRIRALLP